MLSLLLLAPLAAQDVVQYRSAEDGGQRSVAGKVVDWTGEQLRIRLESGSTQTFPTERVVRVDAERTPEHLQGDEAARQGRFEQAIEHYREAARKEQRDWVRRDILAEAVWAYRAAGRPTQAANAFRALIESDPTTHHFQSIPLAWEARHVDDAARSNVIAWLDDASRPASQLIAASWLLSGSERTKATSTLRRLATSADDARVAALASAQIRRTRVVTATDGDVKRWQTAIDRMPASIRAGPYYLLGRAQSRLGASEQAALAWLRVPILYDRHRTLAAESLLAAGRELEKTEQSDEAARLYRELLARFAEQPPAAEAKSRLEKADSS